MLTPGAVMSGFSQLSPVRGPPELKLAKPLKFGFVMLAGARVTLWPVTNFALSARLTPRNGIVTTNGVPSSGFEVILPSNGGSPLTLLTIVTTVAPACWPKIAFATRAQTPRWTTAIVFGGRGPPNAATAAPERLVLRGRRVVDELLDGVVSSPRTARRSR